MATVLMPSARALAMIRQAISPRLAIKILSKGGSVAEAVGEASLFAVFELALIAASQRDIAVLLPGTIELLTAQHGEAAANPLAGRMWHDHVIDEAASAGH